MTTRRDRTPDEPHPATSITAVILLITFTYGITSFITEAVTSVPDNLINDVANTARQLNTTTGTINPPVTATAGNVITVSGEGTRWVITGIHERTQLCYHWDSSTRKLDRCDN